MGNMPDLSKTRVALVQMQCGPEPEANFAKAIARVREAGEQGAQIICLPELFRSQYFCQSEDHANFALAEEIPGPSTEQLGTVARESGAVIIASLFEKRAAGLYHNTAAIIDADGNLLGKYRKMHIPDDPSYYEKFYFTPGDLGFEAWPTPQGKIGVCVCWDQWYPEAARLTRCMGRDSILSHRDRLAPDRRKQNMVMPSIPRWETMQRSHAIANGCFVAAVNRVGHEAPAGGDGIEFWGQSFIVAPSGEILAKASVEREETIFADVEWKRVEEHRTHWPFLRDRRIDAYGGIEQRMLD